MVRPFSGYIAEDGTTFDTEIACEAYEAAYELHATVRKHDMVAALDKLAQDYIVTEVVKFINENKPTVARYLEAGSNPQTIKLQGDFFGHGKDQLRERVGEHELAGGISAGTDQEEDTGGHGEPD